MYVAHIVQTPTLLPGNSYVDSNLFSYTELHATMYQSLLIEAHSSMTTEVDISLPSNMKLPLLKQANGTVSCIYSS